MRNLKKILALVLALVMSLSLMATASAAETTAAANDYSIASTVLQGLGVVRGDDGGIREADPITRAETAALAYRIHTADVTDAKANLYYEVAPFTDLAPVQAWALGYIGYAHNAQIVKGNGDNTFNPTGNITGYEVLAMALRSLGYGKNGEFEGAQWQINTAAWGRREGLLENVSPADQTRLDQPASRGMVFQILLNAILHNDVQFSYVTPDLYVEADASMADRLGLEVETGVVIANEWANLEGSAPISKDTVRVEIADGTTRTINWSAGDKETGGDYETGLKDIGKSRIIYFKGSKVLYLADSGLNDVKDNEGKETKVNTLKGSLTVDGAKHFENFDPAERTYSDWRIEIRLIIAPNAFGDGVRDFQIKRTTVEASTGLGAAQGTDANGNLIYEKVIPAKENITDDQMSIIKEIFRVADDTDKTLKIQGEIYVGTKSNTAANDESNTKSYDQFCAEYIKTEQNPISSVVNGNWLQVVDNDADGAAEYVLLVNYVLDDIVEYDTAKSQYYYRGLDTNSTPTVAVNGYTETVGDVVLYAVIDGKAYVEKAETASAAFKTVNYKDETATDTDGKVWEQSAIGNKTTMPEKLVDVDELTEYTLYLDKYGYVRAYGDRVSYALLTEVYPTRNWNSAWVVDRNLTVEAMRVGDTAVKEYPVLNSYYNGAPNPFYTPDYWYYPGITNNRDNINEYDRPNYLKQATHMLNVMEGGKNLEGDTFWYGYDPLDKFFDQNGQPVDGFEDWRLNGHSWTNVAKYTQTSEGLNLYTAAGTSSNGDKTDYIRLDSHVDNWNTVNKNNPLFPISDEYYDEYYTSAQNHWVRAVDDTVFFLVTVDPDRGTQGIRQYTGYSSLPTLGDADQVRSMYAVARSTAKDTNVNGNDYWVADVIVIETYGYDAYESVALIYSNDSKNQNEVKYVDAIDSVLGNITIIPNGYVWNGSFQGYGFYGLNNVVAVEGQDKTYTADIHWISDGATTANPGWYDGNEYNKHGIYYGQVRSIYGEDSRSTYITLDILDHKGIVVDTKDVRVATGTSWGIKSVDNYINSAVSLVLNATTASNKVIVGDKVFWVETSDRNDARTAGFLIDLTDHELDTYNNVINKRAWYEQPAFLGTVASNVMVAQWNDDQGHHNYYEGDPNAAYTYEEIIGKRNDNTGRTLSVAGAPQNAFVVANYELFANGETVTPTFSGVMDDGLWHIRYNLDVDDIVTVNVKRNYKLNDNAKELVLNSSASYVRGNKTSATLDSTGIIATTAESWSFVMPKAAAGYKVIGTIFEEGTTIDYAAYVSDSKLANDVDRVFATAGVAAAWKTAMAELDAAYTAALEAAKDDAVKTAEIIKAYTEARNNVNTAATWPKDDVPAIEAAKKAGLEAITGKTDPIDPVDPDKVTVTLVNDSTVNSFMTTDETVVDLGFLGTGKLSVDKNSAVLLTLGEELVDYRDLKNTKIGLGVELQVALDADFNNEVDEADGAYEIEVGEEDVTVYLNYYTVEIDDVTGGDTGDDNTGGDTGNDDEWTDVGGETDKGTTQTLEKATGDTTDLNYWVVIPAGNLVRVKNETEITVTNPIHKATAGEIAGIRSAALKTKMEAAAASADEDPYVLTFSVKDGKVVTPQVQTKANGGDPEPLPTEVLPYRAAKTGATNTKYEFYAYNVTRGLTDVEAKTALAVAINEAESLSLTANDIKINGTTVTYPTGSGNSGTVQLTASGAGIQTAPKKLYKVSYSDKVVAYVYDGETAAVGGLKPGYVVVDENKAYKQVQGFSTAYNDIHPVGSDGKTSIVITTPGGDITLIDVLPVTLHSGSTVNEYQWSTDGTNWTSVASGGWVKVGTQLRASVAANPTEGLYQIRADGYDEAALGEATVDEMDIENGKKYIELGTLSADMCSGNWIQLKAERVYTVRLDGVELDGSYTQTSTIPVPELAAGSYVFAETTYSGDRYQFAYESWNSTWEVQKGRGTDPNFITLASPTAVNLYIEDGQYINLFGAVKVEFGTGFASGAKFAKGTTQYDAASAVVGGKTWYVAEDTTITVTPAANKILKITNADKTVGYEGESLASPVAIPVSVGTQNCKIEEVEAPTSFTLSITSDGSSTAIGTSDTVAAGVYGVFTATGIDTTAISGTLTDTDDSTAPATISNGRVYELKISGVTPTATGTLTKLLGDITSKVTLQNNSTEVWGTTNKTWGVQSIIATANNADNSKLDLVITVVMAGLTP